MPPPSKPIARLDPVFLIMIVAVILAVATSFTLRLTAGELGPSRAHADEFTPIPILHHHAAPPIPPSR
jgi:hypothetical protein